EGTIVKESEVCVMCAAGSILAFSLGGNGELKTAGVSFLEKKNMRQLNAVDYLRSGNVTGAAYEIGLTDKLTEDKLAAFESKLEALETDIPEYEIGNPEPFHKAMTALKV